MIYLIDDKIRRQSAYGWTSEKFEMYSNVIKPIYTYSNEEDKNLRDEIFSENNIILFHESFFDNHLNAHFRGSLNIRTDLEKFSQNNPNFLLALFSGSKDTRSFSGNVIHLPVSTLYQNLDVFIKNVKGGNSDLRHLLFGENPDIEKILINKLVDANNNIDKLGFYENTSKNFYLRTSKKNLQNPLQNFHEETLFNKVDDVYFSAKIIEWLSDTEYDNIFIPLCFGHTLSDFNGLRFATHIRCTATPNRLKNIFIYSFVEYSLLINNDCFDILKTKNVTLIDYKKAAFQNAVEIYREQLTKSGLSSEIKKINLSHPNNYEDTHSIINEWAIYRWACAIHASDEQINKIISKVDNLLYFKYLNTIHPVTKSKEIHHKSLALNYNGAPKILFIDDEADKGWLEIFCKILHEDNKFQDFDYLCEEFKARSQDEVINISLEKIKNDDISLVLLDFRLHLKDFNSLNIENVTGFKLLKGIKNINPGIQVIIFSATNKVWNLLELQKAGADGFIVKEAPENSIDGTFTHKSYNFLITQIDKSLKKFFVKALFNDLKILKNQLNSINTLDEFHPFDNFVKELKKQRNIIYSAVENINLDKPITLAIVFLSCYNFIESFKKFYLHTNNYRFILGSDEIPLKRYKVDGEVIEPSQQFIQNDSSDKPGIFHVYSSLLKDYFAISEMFKNDYYKEKYPILIERPNVDYYVKMFYNLKELRNDYIHGNKKEFETEEISAIINSLLPLTFNVIE